MSEQYGGSEHSLTETLSSIFGDMEFRPLPEADNDVIAGGSVRGLHGYDSYAGCGVEVWEFIGLLRERSGLESVHRLITAWDDGSMCEMDIDSGVMVMQGDRQRRTKRTAGSASG